MNTKTNNFKDRTVKEQGGRGRWTAEEFFNGKKILRNSKMKVARFVFKKSNHDFLLCNLRIPLSVKKKDFFFIYLRTDANFTRSVRKENEAVNECVKEKVL